MTTDEKCPTCGADLIGPPRPAVSRVDNLTLVCANCGDLESLLDLFADVGWRTAMRHHWSIRSAVETFRAVPVNERYL